MKKFLIIRRNNGEKKYQIKHMGVEQYYIEHMFIYAFLLFSFFPFIQFFDFGTDLQPYALVTAILYAIYNFVINDRLTLKLSAFQWRISFIAIAGILIVGILSDNAFGGFRDALAYMTILFVSYSGYVSFRKIGTCEKLLKFVIWMYFVVAFIQKYFYSAFFYEIISGHRTSGNRGTPSMTSEPSFYGYTCIFLIFFASDFSKRRLFYIFLLLIQIIIFAKSAVTLLYLLIFAVLLGFNKLKTIDFAKILKILTIFVAGCFVFYLWIKNDSGSRISYLVLFMMQKEMGLTDKVMYLYQTDESIFIRVNDIAICFETFIKSWGLPQGSTSRISSGYGSMLIEIGWLGIFMIVYAFKEVKQAYGKLGFVIAATMTFMMFSSVQLSSPLLSLFYGYCMYKNHIRQCNFSFRIHGSI